MVAELEVGYQMQKERCSLAKISMVAERRNVERSFTLSCSLAKISMVAELNTFVMVLNTSCSLAKISMVAELTA